MTFQVIEYFNYIVVLRMGFATGENELDRRSGTLMLIFLI